MKQHTYTTECPNCGHAIDVNELLYRQLDDELSKTYADKLAKEQQKHKTQYEELEKEQLGLDKAKKELHTTIQTGIQEGLKIEKTQLEKQLRKKAEEEQSERIQSLHDELNLKSKQLIQFNKARSEIERLKREKNELKEAIEADSERKLNERLNIEREKIHKNAQEKERLKLSEKNHLIEQLKDQLDAARRKAEQGSTQLQGEVQELAIEDWLANNFPLDAIEEIKKGARGADCLQIINTKTVQNCGSIYYESKRTKVFQPLWIEKFKNDIRDKRADIGVLVTESMPKDMKRVGLKDGIWICTFEEFKGLCGVLRESIIRLSYAITTQENRGDKMEILYDFLTSNEFRLQVEAIVEGFTQMQKDLELEKRSFQSIWKQREKHIEKVILNTNLMYSSIKGIAGSAIQPVPLLELPSGKEADE